MQKELATVNSLNKDLAKEDNISNNNKYIKLSKMLEILNSFNGWVSIDNDRLNDVVLTPRFVTNLMARICRTDMDSFLWDTCMGSSGFLVSGMDLMIADAKSKIKDNS